MFQPVDFYLIIFGVEPHTFLQHAFTLESTGSLDSPLQIKSSVFYHLQGKVLA